MGELLGGRGQVEGLVIPVYIDETAFQNGLKSIDKGMMALTKRVGSMANTVGNYGLVASGALAGIGFAALTAARDAESASIKFRAVFGEAAADSLKFAEQLGTTFNMTTSEVQKFMAQVQDLFVPMGMSRREAAKLSEQVVDLATRVAVFNGQPTALTLQNITSGLVGVTRSVRQYGILLSEAGVKQEIMNQGWAKSEKEITEQQKVLARLNIMLASSADAMAKAPSLVADSIKGQMDKVAKAFQDLREELGFALAPVLKDLVKDIGPILKDWVEWVKENKDLIVSIGKLVPQIAVFSAGMKVLGGTLTSVVRLTQLLGGATAAGLGAGAAIGAAATGAAYLHYKAGLIRAEAQEQAAKDILKQTDIQLKSLLAHERKLRLDHARKVAGESVDAFFEEFRDKFQEGSQAVEPFMQATMEMIGTASKDALVGLESDIETMLLTTREFTLEQYSTLVAAMSARTNQLYAEELAKTEETEKKKAEIRTKTFEESMKRLQGAVMRNLEAELSGVRAMMDDQRRIREGALQDILDARAQMIEREISHEQFLWEAALGDPEIEGVERYVRTEQRISDLVDSAARAMDEGNAEVARQLLGQAEQLAKGLISINEFSFETRLADATRFLEEIGALHDELAEREIDASTEAAAEAARNLEGLKVVAESMLLDVEEQVSRLAASASKIPVTLDISQALAQLAQLQAQLESMRGEAGVAPRAGVEAGLEQVIEQTVNVFTEPLAEIGGFFGNLADKVGSALRRGDAG